MLINNSLNNLIIEIHPLKMSLYTLTTR